MKNKVQIYKSIANHWVVRCDRVHRHGPYSAYADSHLAAIRIASVHLKRQHPR